jgi:hypothetical protein
MDNHDNMNPSVINSRICFSSGFRILNSGFLEKYHKTTSTLNSRVS